MDASFLQDLLREQAQRYQGRGLAYSQALDAALRHLSHSVSLSLCGLEGMRMRARLHGAAKNLTESQDFF